MSSLIDSRSASSTSAELLIEVEVDALVVLQLAFSEDLVAGELVERHEDVAQPEDLSEQGDEPLLLVLSDDPDTEREVVLELDDALRVFGLVVAVRLEQDDAARILVAEQRQGVVGRLVQVPEGDDVAVGLDRVEDPVGARVRLEKPVLPEVLVDPERVQRCRVEPGQEHVHDDRQVDLATLQPR